ncbi:DUF6585 family protein [Nocardia sp. CDC153]|uniref:DUF6585 family protein n=1 Tax=Nocardia sp. CDC153 TaxID=3112167 RepID=UPI002DBAD711|nr:DUF6585 family protein [Nocardia sp. CDC153]MEC3955020.1 DUF6585 family protein [Nocardia sp. CDC153]
MAVGIVIGVIIVVVLVSLGWSGNSKEREQHRRERAQSISDVAIRAGLGGHSKTFGPVPADWHGIGRLAQIFVGLVGVTVLGFGVHVAVLQFAMYLALIVGLGLVFSILSAVFYGQRNAGGRLDLFEHGLVFTLKSRQQVVRYDSTTLIQDLIEHRRNGVTIRVTQAYELTDIDGRPLRLREGISNPEEWGPQIQQQVGIHQMPAALATLGAGRPMEFGTITLQPAGISAFGTLVPWAEITDVEIAEGQLRIKTGAGRPAITTNISSLRNFNLVCALIRHGRGIRN